VLRGGFAAGPEGRPYQILSEKVGSGLRPDRSARLLDTGGVRMKKFLIYNFSGEVDEISHLFPSERLAAIAAIIETHGGRAVLVDRANFTDLRRFGSSLMKELGSMSFHDSSKSYETVLLEEARTLEVLDCDVMFLNMWHGTGFKFSVDLLGVLKKSCPSLRVYGIGQKVDWFKEHIFKLTSGDLDGLITGLGYDAVESIVLEKDIRAVPNLLRVAGSEVIDNGRKTVNVDDYPSPSYDETSYPGVGEKVPVYSVSLSNQACPNRCVFCIRPENYGRVVKRRNMATVIAEMERLYSENGVTHFRVADSTPPGNALTDLARNIVGSTLEGRITLTAFARVDINSMEDFDLMKRAGFLSLFFGLESLDDDNLARLRKGITYEAIKRTLERAHAAGILTVASFIFPTPGETRESMENTLRRIGELKPFLDSVLFLPAGVYPPTEWGQSPEKFGIKLADDYISELIIYPIKYEVPLRHWRPFPFSYRLMGKEADNVTFADIVAVQEEFAERMKNDIGIARIPDYYFLVAHLLQRDPAEVSEALVTGIMNRDYDGLREMFARRGEQ